ncbi:ribosomal RNA processing protein 36 homolog [Leptopilina heterotoma]|uniref:ribosomal RNA processing protein 36 homolog n=1 Tax=Leptopilina heterotoma TaxID=63436 RepID=UPI001CAA2537|nr:ribosomal RNA processing protein 36 homolog [Leptopilina heterotoma]
MSRGSNSDEELFINDKSRTDIRAELSKMSFADLQKLKEKLGSKVYNEAMFGKPIGKKTVLKRENKNRPQEISSKKRMFQLKKLIPVKQNVPRDPRFDSLCGTYNEKAFKNAYSFLTEVKKNDLTALKDELNKNAEDPKAVKKIKYLIQRLENQIREEGRRKEAEDKKQLEKREIIKTIKSGEKPNFRKKSERKILDLVSQYDDLKNSGKLKKHIKRLRKKNASKDRRRLEESNSD